MSSSPEIINFISANQFKSISYIEKFSDLSLQKDFGFDYSIALQTKAKLSTVIDIFVSKDELVKYFINPLKELHKKSKSLNLQPVEVEIKSYIPGALFSYSALNKLLPDSYVRDCAKNGGFTEYFKIKYSLEDKFIKIETSAYYRTFILKRKPKIIQPKTLSLSLDEIDELILLIETSLI